MLEDFRWLKAFHILVMVSWMAGIFYLPRIAYDHTALQRFAAEVMPKFR